MKIYEILKEENIEKTYKDNLIEQEWKIASYIDIYDKSLILALESLEDEEDIKDNIHLNMQEILDMEFEEFEE